MNRAVLHFQNIVCIAMWSVVTCSNYFKWNLSKEQTVINLSFMLVNVHLYLILCTYIVILYYNNDYIEGTYILYVV